MFMDAIVMKSSMSTSGHSLHNIKGSVYNSWRYGEETATSSGYILDFCAWDIVTASEWGDFVSLCHVTFNHTSICCCVCGITTLELF